MIPEETVIKVLQRGEREYSVITTADKYLLTAADFRAVENDVAEGSLIDGELSERLRAMSDKLSCIKKSMKHLEYGSLTEKKLRQKLKGAFEIQAIEESIALLKEYGYIDDFALCRELCFRYFTENRFGKGKIKQKLYEKMFYPETVKAVLEEFEFDGEIAYENMSLLLREKFPDALELSKDRTGKNKMVSYLLRWGYSYDEISSVISDDFFDE